MRPRILINLAFFALLGIVLAFWAGGTLIRVDAVERPYHVTADFTSSPGLRHDLEVTYLGVGVGRVGTVRLETGKVTVRLDLDHGTHIPANARATVLRKSAIGEPYIDLSLPNESPGRPFKDGDSIPLSRTAGTVDYKRLFDDFSKALEAVNPNDAHTVVRELAVGLAGRGDSIHGIIGDTHQLTSTLADNSALLDDLSVQLTQLTHTVAGHRGQLASGVNDLDSFTASLTASRKQFDAILEQGPTFLERARTMVDTARPSLDCLLDAAATPGPPIFTAKTSATVRQILITIPTFRALAEDVTLTTGGHTYIKARPMISVAGVQAAEEYPTPIPQPVAPPVSRCPAATTTSAKTGEKKTGKGTDVADTTPSASPDPTITGSPVAGNEPSNSPGIDTARLLPLLPIVLGGVVLLCVVANTLRVAVRRRSE
ncbi:MCE family protein [Actinomadura barringtoniae]|uniref:MCE family protein n=1 Tax=Actinomadura barringtoniae TaxID=1427535 RepID=A0A939PFJ9_9ACTN|nr:MlaD family protein [Actinomadura barringtoniae]MBO2447586.1 MCE family protein [Actinomadura barringtoniae]